MNEADCQAHAFAESVRKQALHIAALVGAGLHNKAAEAALSLCSQAAERKREVEEKQDQIDPVAHA
jgi:hypothetical protein